MKSIDHIADSCQRELSALEPDDSHAAELARSAKQALDAGRLAEGGWPAQSS